MPFTQDQKDRMTHMKNMLEVSSNINLMYTVLAQMTNAGNDPKDLKKLKGEPLLQKMISQANGTYPLSQKVEIAMDDQEFTIIINESETGGIEITLTRDLEERQSTPYTATFSAKVEGSKVICTPIVEGRNLQTDLENEENKEFFKSLFGPNYKQAIGETGLIPTQKPTPFTMRPILAIALLKYVEHKGAQLTSKDMEAICALMDLGPALGKTTIQVAIAQATVLAGEKVCMVVPHSGLVEAMIKDSIATPITKDSISTDITDLSQANKDCFIITVSQLEDLIIRKKLSDGVALSAEEDIKAQLKDLKPLNPNELKPYDEIIGNTMIDEAHELEEKQDYDFKSRFDITREEDIKKAEELIAEKGLNKDTITMDRPSILREMSKNGATFLSGSCIQGINSNSDLYLNPIITALMRHAIEWKLLRDADLEHVYSEEDPYQDALISRMFDLTPIQETDKDYTSGNDYLSASSGKSFIYMDYENIGKESKKIKKTCALLNNKSFGEITKKDKKLAGKIQTHIEVSAEKIFREKLKKTDALYSELNKAVSDLSTINKDLTQDNTEEKKNLKGKISKLYKNLTEEITIQERILQESLTKEYGKSYYQYFKDKYLPIISYNDGTNILTEARQATTSITFNKVFAEVQEKKNNDTNKITGQAITGMALSILIKNNIKNYDKYVALNLAKKPLLDKGDKINANNLTREKIEEMLLTGDFKNLNDGEKKAYLDIMMFEIKRIQAYSEPSKLEVRKMTRSELESLNFHEIEILNANDVTHETARNALGLSTTLCASPKFAAGISDKAVLSVFIPIESEKSAFFTPSTLAQAIGRAFRSDNLRALVKFVIGKSVYQKDNTTSLSSGKVSVENKQNDNNTWKLLLKQIHVGLHDIMNDPKPHFIEQANSQDRSTSSPSLLTKGYTYNQKTVEDLNNAYNRLLQKLGQKVVPQDKTIQSITEEIIKLETQLSLSLIKQQKIIGTPSPQESVVKNTSTTPPPSIGQQRPSFSPITLFRNIKIKREDISITDHSLAQDLEKKRQTLITSNNSNIATIIANSISNTLVAFPDQIDQKTIKATIPVGYQQYIKSSRPSTAETASVSSAPNAFERYESLLKSPETLGIDEINNIIGELDKLILKEKESARTSPIHESENNSDSAHNRSSDESGMSEDDEDDIVFIKPIRPSTDSASSSMPEEIKGLIKLKSDFEDLKNGLEINSWKKK